MPSIRNGANATGAAFQIFKFAKPTEPSTHVSPWRFGKIENDRGLAKSRKPTRPCRNSCVTVPGRLITATCHLEFRVERMTTNQVRISTADASASVVMETWLSKDMLRSAVRVFAISSDLVEERFQIETERFDPEVHHLHRDQRIQ